MSVQETPVRRHLQQPRTEPGTEAGPDGGLPRRGQHARAALRPLACGGRLNAVDDMQFLNNLKAACPFGQAAGIIACKKLVLGQCTIRKGTQKSRGKEWLLLLERHG